MTKYILESTPIFKTIKVLIVLGLSFALLSCLNMSQNHPIVGKWELVEGTLLLPATLEFEPSGRVVGDNTLHGRFALTDEGDIRLTFPQYTWSGKIGFSSMILTLNDLNSNSNRYKRTRLCSSEMGSSCRYDNQQKH